MFSGLPLGSAKLWVSHATVPSRAEAAPAFQEGEGTGTRVSPSKLLNPLTWLFVGVEGKRPVATPAVSTQTAYFQNHATDRIKNTIFELKGA